MAKTKKPQLEIEIENLGPVAALTIPLPEAGGVVILRGENGAGKSTVVDGVTKLIGGKAPGLSASDGAKRGSVRLGDATLTVTQSRQAVRGELEVVGLESRLDLSALVDPGIASAESADAKRLRALVSLANKPARPEYFHDLVGGPDAYAAMAIEPTDDVILLADRVKRACEKRAREFESLADAKRAEAEAGRRAANGVDLEAEAGEQELADRYANAKAHAEEMVRHNEAVAVAAKAAQAARDELEALGEYSDDPAALKAEEVALRKQSAAKLTERDGLLAKAEQVRQEAQQLSQQADDLVNRRLQAERGAAKRERLLELTNASVSAPFQQESIEEAQQAARDALAAIGAGQRIRQARAAHEAAEGAAAEAKAAQRSANVYRNQAAATDAVLSSLLPEGCPLRLEAGRLVTETARSKSEPFAELSDGERWNLAINFAAAQLPPHGLLTIPQAAWESLAPTLQASIDAWARERGVVILTAHVADGPLTVETLQ